MVYIWVRISNKTIKQKAGVSHKTSKLQLLAFCPFPHLFYLFCIMVHDFVLHSQQGESYSQLAITLS